MGLGLLLKYSYSLS